MRLKLLAVPWSYTPIAQSAVAHMHDLDGTAQLPWHICSYSGYSDEFYICSVHIYSAFKTSFDVLDTCRQHLSRVKPGQHGCHLAHMHVPYRYRRIRVAD
jgi:hypothetical protein